MTYLSGHGVLYISLMTGDTGLHLSYVPDWYMIARHVQLIYDTAKLCNQAIRNCRNCANPLLSVGLVDMILVVACVFYLSNTDKLLLSNLAFSV